MKITKRQLKRIIKEEKQKLLREFFDFKAAAQKMIKCATEMGTLLAGRPDVAMAVRDALADGPFEKSGAALYKAYEAAQGAADTEYMSFGAGYDKDDDFYERMRVE